MDIWLYRYMGMHIYEIYGYIYCIWCVLYISGVSYVSQGLKVFH